MNIIAIGGGGFTHGTDPQLENYILGTVGIAQPKIGFLATASEDDETKITRFYERFKSCGKPTHLPMSSSKAQLETWTLRQDVVYVGGGNTNNMINIWQQWGLPEILRIALSQNITLAGVSAGAVCWFETALSDSTGKGLHPLPCLGLLSGSCCPHFDEADSQRRQSFVKLIADGALQNGIGIDDGVAVHYQNGEIFNVVSARPDARAYVVKASGNEAVTNTLAVNVLPPSIEH